MLCLAEHPVKKTQIGARDIDTACIIYAFVERELYPLDQMKCDCIFETTIIVRLTLCVSFQGNSHELEADINEV